MASAATRLDHMQQLGADVLYLNPVMLGYTNHKYDTLDHEHLLRSWAYLDNHNTV